MTLKQSSKLGTIKVNKPLSPLPITSIIQITEDASAWPIVDGASIKDGFAYCDGSTLTNTDGKYDDFNTANGSLVLPNGPFRTKEVDLTFSNTPAGWSLIAAKGFAFTDTEGDWWFTFYIDASATAFTNQLVDIDGVVFLDNQACTGFASSPSRMAAKVVAQDLDNTIAVSHDSSNTAFDVAGTVRLSEKPTWADANMESYPVISLQNNVAGSALGLDLTSYGVGTTIETTSDTTYDIISSGTVTVTGMTIDLTEGTWMVQANLLFQGMSAGNASIRSSLYNDTLGSEYTLTRQGGTVTNSASDTGSLFQVHTLYQTITIGAGATETISLRVGSNQTTGDVRVFAGSSAGGMSGNEQYTRLYATRIA